MNEKPQEPPPQTCSNCRFWREAAEPKLDGSRYGECRISPVQLDYEGMSVWPSSSSGAWCGKWEYQDTMPSAPYCFGVLPGGVFVVRDAQATFRVINEGERTLRVTAQVLLPADVPGGRS